MKKSMMEMDSGNIMWVVIGVIVILAIVYFVVRLFRNKKESFSDYSCAGAYYEGFADAKKAEKKAPPTSESTQRFTNYGCEGFFASKKDEKKAPPTSESTQRFTNYGYEGFADAKKAEKKAPPTSESTQRFTNYGCEGFAEKKKTT